LAKATWEINEQGYEKFLSQNTMRWYFHNNRKGLNKWKYLPITENIPMNIF